jgi:hypothetical protein
VTPAARTSSVVTSPHAAALPTPRTSPARSNRDDHRVGLELDTFDDETTDAEEAS